MQFSSHLSCNSKIEARVNQVQFSVRFVAAIPQGFRTCLKLDATLARQILHRVTATKIVFVNGALSHVGLAANCLEFEPWFLRRVSVLADFSF